MVSENQQRKAKKTVETGGVVMVEKDLIWNVRGTNDSYRIKKNNDEYVCEKLDQDDSVFEICKGWINCKGALKDKTCSHIEAVKLFELLEAKKTEEPNESHYLKKLGIRELRDN